MNDGLLHAVRAAEGAVVHPVQSDPPSPGLRRASLHNCAPCRAKMLAKMKLGLRSVAQPRGVDAAATVVPAPPPPCIHRAKDESGGSLCWRPAPTIGLFPTAKTIDPAVCQTCGDRQW